MTFEIMKKTILSYSAPEVNVYEVVAERALRAIDDLVGDNNKNQERAFENENNS